MEKKLRNNNIEQLANKIIDCIKNKKKYMCDKCEIYKLENVLKEVEQIYKRF